MTSVATSVESKEEGGDNVDGKGQEDDKDLLNDYGYVDEDEEVGEYYEEEDHGYEL